MGMEWRSGGLGHYRPGWYRPFLTSCGERLRTRAYLPVGRNDARDHEPHLCAAAVTISPRTSEQLRLRSESPDQPHHCCTAVSASTRPQGSVWRYDLGGTP